MKYISVLLVFVGVFACGLPQAHPGKRSNDAGYENKLDMDDWPVAKRTKSPVQMTRSFIGACRKAGIAVKACKRKAKKLARQCVSTETETESTPSDSEYDGADNIFQPVIDFTHSPIATRDTIKAAHQKACHLQKHGEHTFAAESLETTIYKLQHQNIAMDSAALPEFANLFQLWASLPHITKEKSQAQSKIRSWMDSWPAVVWLDRASEVLIEMLAAAFETEVYDDAAPPEYSDIWLDDMLDSIEDLRVRSSIRHLVQASAADDPVQREEYLRNAILAGYSHPLPYLQTISHLVNQERHEEAHHVFEMYRLAVIFNRRWSNSGNATHGLEYDRRRELYRLQDVYETSAGLYVAKPLCANSGKSG